METMKVYRNGPVGLGRHTEYIRKLWAAYDEIKPSGRAGRLNSVYASPSLVGMVRWTHTNLMNPALSSRQDLSNHEITVLNPESLYVYHVNSYDKTSSAIHCYGELGDPTYADYNAELLQPYWDTGIRLSEWQERSAKEGLNAMEWEVLIPAESIVSHRQINDNEVIEAASEDAREHLTECFRQYNEFIAWIEQEK